METIPRWTLDPVPGAAEYKVPLPEGVEAGPAALAAAHTKVLAALSGEDVPAEDTGLDAYVTDGTLRLRYRTDVLDAEAAARIAGYHLTALADPERRSLLSEAELRFQVDELAGPRRELPDRRVHELFEGRAAADPDAVAAVQGERQWTYGELNARANQLGRALLARGLRREGVVAVVMERNLDWMAAVLAVLKAGGVYLPVEPHFPAGRIAATLDRAGCELVLTERGSAAALRSPAPNRTALFVDAAYAEGHPDTNLGVPVPADRLAYIYFTSGSTGEPKGAMCEHAGFLNHVLAKLDDLGIGAGDVVAQTAPQCFDISLWQLLAAPLAGGRTLLVEQETVLDVARFVDTVERGRVNVLQVVPSYLDAVMAELAQRPRELPDLRCVSVTGEAVKKELVQRWFTARPAIPLVNAYGLTETCDDTNHEVMHRVPDGERVPLGRPIANVRVYVVDERLVPVPLGAPGEIVFSGVCVGRGYVNDPERTAAAFTEDPYRPGERLYRSGDHGRWLPDGKLEFLGRRDSQVKIRGFRIEIGEIENALLRVPGVRDGAVVVVRGAQLVAFCAGPEPVGADVVRERLAASLPAYMVPSVVHWRQALPLTANGKTDRRTLTSLAEEPGPVPKVAPAERRPARSPTALRAWEVPPLAAPGESPSTSGPSTGPSARHAESTHQRSHQPPPLSASLERGDPHRGGAPGPPFGRTTPLSAQALDAGKDVPATPGERRMAAAWAEVLGIPADRIGRLDHFFDRGGTSLAAVKLVIALDRAITLQDVTRRPVLADLAGLLDTARPHR
ncbi:non-ribosomal peptide synthetase [Streptomyces sp. NL15-2K]|uniref:non-ribosomal peptide synthetase n=1 Tax=Streptomyces sp. NL15-2K TaxID=376149 RepID=UPI000FF921F7|nr:MULTISPECIES: non-ribosomal peptide synthetase [Actinomycetes]WKX13514.1 amino acid adenylation domain-containing protein [Kutzneria buriramensis]GCB45101.1 peptide synthetase [Streptomyces sp. NL15-2K]